MYPDVDAAASSADRGRFWMLLDESLILCSGES